MNLLGQFGPVGGEKGEMIAYFCPSLLFFIFLNRTFKYDFLFFLGGGGEAGLVSDVLRFLSLPLS